jgi:NADH-quinone oxidoreductase subunit L
MAGSFRGLYNLILNKYFVDEFYDSTVVRPVVDGSRTLLWRTVDAGMIDGAVNGVGKEARDVGGILKLAQSGYIRSYAAWVVAGSILLLVMVGLAGGAR